MTVYNERAKNGLDDIKGTVSPDIGLHFSFWKIIFVLSAGPLMVLTFFYSVVPEIFKY